MKLAEQLLYALAKRMYQRNPGQSERMTEALVDDESYGLYRRECFNTIRDSSSRHHVPLSGCHVLDLGCYDGTITENYLDAGATRVTGVDIDEAAIDRAQRSYTDSRLDFRVGRKTALPVDDSCVDSIICYDVFEHVEKPAALLQECHRVLKPGGRMLIGTWGWYHPFAPHLWSIMPVPWAHVVFSERTMLRVCRRIYHSDWYVPNMHDFDADGERKPDKFDYESIPTDYLNKFLIRDFEQVFRNSPLQYQIHSQRFSSRWAAWTQPLLTVPFLKEFFTSYIWVVLRRPESSKPQTEQQPVVELAGCS